MLLVSGEEMEKLLTVVIPTYNTERFLKQCLDSMLQVPSAGRTELLVVDDGSRDRSGEIAEEYAAKYPDIVRVIHKENGGHGSAINTGITLATGKYFKVVDSDDRVDSREYEAYLEKLENLECDVVATTFTCVWYADGETEELQSRIVKEQKRRIEGAKRFPENTVLPFETVADRLHVRMHEWTIRTEILKKNGIVLSEHSFYVDMQYILFPIPRVKTICILPENVYRYRLGEAGQSVSIKNMQKNREQHRNVLRSLVAFYKEREQQGDSEAVLDYLAKGIAKMQADGIQTVLSLPVGKAAKTELLVQEGFLKQECPAAYQKNQKKSITLLRRSRYLLYSPAAWIWKRIKG